MFRKLVYLLLGSLLFTLPSMAQPVLSAATNCPLPGDIFVYHRCDTTGGVSVGASGAALTWDFSSLHELSTDTGFIHSCSSTTLCDSFPGSSFVQVNGDNYTYYDTSSTALYITGVALTGSTTYNLRYSNTELSLNYRLTYNNYYTDTGTGFDGYYSYLFVDTFKYDGYGTLILPSGTVHNVMRIHRNSFETITHASVTNIYRTEGYYWYVPNYHNNILNIEYYYTGNPAIANLSFCPPNEALGTSDLSPGTKPFYVYPNPATSELTIESNGRPGGDYTIINCLGQQVLANACTDAKTVVDISKLPPGVYHVRLKSGDNASAQTFVKQ